jgi:hypothetical protein
MEKLRIVQIDLARQKETLDTVFGFFDFAKKYGYNTVALYLEDRIKTAVYPYASDEESYSEDEARRMAEYADSIGIELIPVVSNFGHTERFLEHEKLHSIAEIREGQGFMGREIKLTVCPLLSESQNFFDTYFSEVAALFPKSRYFHAGLDEVWDIGYCELCKKDVKENGGIGHLFLNHIKRTNNLINSLGKEMIMWDDMLIYCPEIIPEIPKNVIMCSWCYDFIDPSPRSPFANSEQSEFFREYDKYGIRYMPAVWCNFTHNVDTYTKYCENYSPIGYYNTTWQMDAEEMLFMYPLIAYTGMLWSGKYVDEPLLRMNEVVREVIGAKEPLDVAVLARACDKPYLNRGSIYFIQDLIVRRNVNFEDEYKDICYLYDLIPALQVDNDYVKAIKYRIERAKILYETLVEAQNLLDMQGGLYEADTDKILKNLAIIKETMHKEYDEHYEMWNKYRPGIPRAELDSEKRAVLGNLERLIKRAQTAKFGENGMLNMQFLLPEKTIYDYVTVSVEYTDGTVQQFPKTLYKSLAGPCYNIADKGPYFYIYSRLIDGTREPKSIDISVYGVGSTTIQYAFCYLNGKRYLPTSVTPYGKYHENCEHLLVNDTRWAVIGNYSMKDAMTVEGLRDEVSGVKIELAPEN